MLLLLVYGLYNISGVSTGGDTLHLVLACSEEGHMRRILVTYRADPVAFKTSTVECFLEVFHLDLLFISNLFLSNSRQLLLLPLDHRLLWIARSVLVTTFANWVHLSCHGRLLSRNQADPDVRAAFVRQLFVGWLLWRYFSVRSVSLPSRHYRWCHVGCLG